MYIRKVKTHKWTKRNVVLRSIKKYEKENLGRYFKREGEKGKCKENTEQGLVSSK